MDMGRSERPYGVCQLLGAPTLRLQQRLLFEQREQHGTIQDRDTRAEGDASRTMHKHDVARSPVSSLPHLLLDDLTRAGSLERGQTASHQPAHLLTPNTAVSAEAARRVHRPGPVQRVQPSHLHLCGVVAAVVLASSRFAPVSLGPTGDCSCRTKRGEGGLP